MKKNLFFGEKCPCVISDLNKFETLLLHPEKIDTSLTLRRYCNFRPWCPRLVLLIIFRAVANG